MSSTAVKQAHMRIQSFLHNTPLIENSTLNDLLQSKIYFKCENKQKIGAFKARGALNTLLTLKEENRLPGEVVAYSSGNHAQAVAWAAQLLGIKATIFIPATASSIKIKATQAYGAEVIITKDRQEAEDRAHEKAKTCFLLPPYDHIDVIAGQGTAAFEAWKEHQYDAVFAPCGGGGLISGTYLATRFFSPDAKVFAAEPIQANDAARSLSSGVIQRYKQTPDTIADGVRTLSISPLTFEYIKQLDGLYEISEDEIIYWTQWLTHFLKESIEPTSALGMAAAYKWIKEGNKNKKILIILSGGNLDTMTHGKIWHKDYLNGMPSL